MNRDFIKEMKVDTGGCLGEVHPRKPEEQEQEWEYASVLRKQPNRTKYKGKCRRCSQKGWQWERGTDYIVPLQGLFILRWETTGACHRLAFWEADSEMELSVQEVD